MAETFSFDSLGEADLQICGLRLWVGDEDCVEHDTEHEIFGESVTLTVYCLASRSRSYYRRPFFRVGLNERLGDFIQQCNRLNEGVSETAVLELWHPGSSFHPMLTLRMEKEGSRGHLRARVELDLTGDPNEIYSNSIGGPQKHMAEFYLDQSYLPEILADCKKVKARVAGGMS